MSASNDDDNSVSSPEGRALDRLVTEAKADDPSSGAPEIDWDRLESRLMATVEEESKERARLTAAESSRARVLRMGALVFAAAAAAALVVRSRSLDTERRAQIDVPVTAPAPAIAVAASSLKSTEGVGSVRVGGAVISSGFELHVSDDIDVDRARAVFERSRKVAWLIEHDGQSTARAHVKSAGEPLVLGLDHGAIEAQVVPVPVGTEAFAVDVATERSLVRVAVHGTHLRVARVGDHVTVDLTEGVISIGVPPPTGITTGTTVAAPAHVELDATDLGTLRVEHTPELVRPAIPLDPFGGTRTTALAVSSDSPPLLSPPTRAASTPTLAMSASPKAPKIDKAIVPPRQAIADAVRECALARTRSGGDVTHVTVSSNLRLTVSATGAVERAQFSPPLPVEIQSCAAEVIYKTKLEDTGLVTIPIEFTF